MAGYKATGGCLCGGVKFEFTKPLCEVHTCHCSMCRKVVGADYATIGWVPFVNFNLLKKDTLQEYVSSDLITRCFCGVCGCSVFCKCPSEYTAVPIYLGTLDGDPGTAIEYHIFESSKAPWVKINDNLPRCDGYELLDMEALKK